LPLAKILSAGIAHRHDPAMAMVSAGITEFSVMRRGLPALDTIVTLAPLLGLLGTILGMINSFFKRGPYVPILLLTLVKT
jgi:biopolymer transport protein ExbB